ncbi:MAG: hypothetical protein GX758_02560 [Tenericutes bacterium]|nr:hypothetical protein [Mycoplasmatota bacterium]
MSVQSTIATVNNAADNLRDADLAQARARLENIVGSIGTGLSNFWDGGFAGIDENGLEGLKNAIRKYCSGVEGIIEEFNEQAKMESAYKGSIQEASVDFVKSVKEILQAYVSTMKRNIDDANLAFQNYKAGAQQISQNVISDASDIRSEASKIRLD